MNHYAKPRSFFVENLITFLALAIASYILDNLVWGFNTFFEIVFLFSIISFVVGILYGVFRLGDVIIPPLEAYYQRVPWRLFYPGDLTDVIMKEPPVPVPPPHGVSKEHLDHVQTMHKDKGDLDSRDPNVQYTSTHTNSATSSLYEPFEWQSLFSFKYLRYCGVLLIVSALFSIIFNIEWELIHKIYLSGGIGIIAFVCAEIANLKKKTPFAVVASLIGFALLHVMIALLAQYGKLQDWTEYNALWILAKLTLSYLYLFPLHRYKEQYHAVPFLLIAYLTPISLVWNTTELVLWSTVIYLVGMSALALIISLREKCYGLLVCNNLIMNAYIFLMFIDGPELGFSLQYTDIWWPVYALGGLFVLHLVATVIAAMRTPTLNESAQLSHEILAHLFYGIGIGFMYSEIPLLEQYFGVALLCTAACSFVAYMITQIKDVETQTAQVLLNLSIIVASVGIFIQVDGPWTSIVFLGYSVLVLWLSLQQHFIRTRVYGFIILTVSIVKLYLEFRDVFDSIPGSIAVLIIGFLLVVLSYKFEHMKDLFLNGFDGKKDSV